MPEVVEVNITAQYLKSKILGKTLTAMNIKGGRYSRKEMTGKELFTVPVKVNDVQTKGKFMYIDLGYFYLASTFGLSGSWGFVESKHSNVSFTFDSGDIMYYTDSLGFGTISFLDKSGLGKKLNSLEDDVLYTNFSADDFYKKLVNYKNKKLPIVSVLMEQKKGTGIFAGIGNYLSVEILYHAKVDPHSTVNGIIKNRAVCDKLANSIKYITKLAYFRSNVGYMMGLDTKFIKKIRRDDEKLNKIHSSTVLDTSVYFEFNVYGQSADPYNNPIKKAKIIKSRTTYFCPTVQVLYD